MAVQAQYPSNVLLLNRNVQEGKNVLSNDYSLQPQPGGFLDQSHMLFNNGGVNGNTRKRGREIGSSMATPTAMNQFSMPDSQPLQLIDLSQLHNHQTPNVVSTGLRLSFADQLHQQQHQNLMPHSSSSSSSSSPSFFFSEDLASQIKQQRDEIDQFLQAQGEQLRRTIAEKRQRYYRALLSTTEEMVARKLREKEADVEKAARRNAELEAKAAQLSVEAQVWQAKARAQEATAASLQAQLQQAIMSGGCAPAQDQEGGGLGLRCAGSGRENQAEDAESAYIDPERVEPVGPVCKACRRRAASVVLLPCRHLCLCTECDAVAQACPLCLSHRNASVEVFLC